MAYGAGSLTDAEVEAVAVCGDCESASAIGREAKRSVATEAVWKVWEDGGLWRDHGRETLGSRPPTKTDSLCVGRRPPWPGPERPTL